MKTKVKTVYGHQSMREPDISEYDSREVAEQAVKTVLKWGIDIVSAEIMEEEKCEHGKAMNDYCEPCGRIHGGGDGV